MNTESPRLIEFGTVQSGNIINIINKTNSAKKYTFQNGEFGEISFTLIVGAECQLKVGTVAPIITMDDVETLSDENVRPV